MQGLNYHHLLYFWLAAKRGGVTAAARQLNLAQPTISGQIRQLEITLGSPLFTRAGRGLELTEVGRLVYSYADEIFALGEELVGALKGELARPQRLVVGLAPGVSPIVVAKLLRPVLAREPVALEVRNIEDGATATELTLRGIDMLVSAGPIEVQSARANLRLLGESPIGFYGIHELVEQATEGFPRSLDRVPLLLPKRPGSTRDSVLKWLAEADINPRIAAECDDAGLLVELARSGLGVFPAPQAIGADLASRHGLECLGIAGDLREQYFAVIPERRMRQRAVEDITDAANHWLEPVDQAAQ